jgi:quercetin dioxygenase-like cupin family protein
MTTHEARPANEATPIVVELGEAIRTIDAAAGRSTAERTARSLFQSGDLGAVLTSLRPGAAVHNEQPDEAATIQGIRGRCLVSVDGQGAVLDEGTLVAIPRGMSWRLVAQSDAVVLLTISRP